MKNTDYIREKINRFPKGYVFTYKDFITAVNQRESVIKFLNRLVASDKIGKLSKGRYFKIKESVFGNILPNEKEVVKDLLEKDGKPIGYLSRVSFFNQAGFTTQVSNTFTIARNDIRPPLQRGFYRIKFFKQKNTITTSNIPLLRLLDVMRFIRRIPDSSFKQSVIRLTSLIQELSSDDKKILIKLAYKYNPAVRALLGALLEAMAYENTNNELEKLKASLNPITKYKIGIKNDILPTVTNWNIL